MLMKKNLLLGLLLSSNLTAWAQSVPPRVQLSCPKLLAPHRLANRASAPLVPESFSRDAPLAPPASNYCTGVINVNIHYMLLLDGTGNFNETDDGAAYTPWNQPGVNVPADTTNNGYARALVTDMNIQAAKCRAIIT